MTKTETKTKTKTAVEWFVNQLFDKVGLPVTKENNPALFELIEQAKAMEEQQRREQVEEAYYCGADEESDRHGAMYKSREDATQYYNRTFSQ